MNPAVRPLVLAIGACAAAACDAAGGHHAVDDATILDPGQCQLETWADSFGPGGGAQHIGPACRFGAWEIGVNLDRARFGTAPAARAAGVQGKWVMKLSDQLSTGIVVGPSWQQGRYDNTMVLVPLTWQPSANWLVHVNAGRQWNRGGPGRNLAGIAAEWTAGEQLSFVAERFNDAIGRAARVGARWQLAPAVSLDLSRAHAFADARGRWWTLGLNFVADGAIRP
ncbi:hypothetical protein [Ramlibacter humi]|uniref:Transporter n=1 Tax=Ramlibacter humi TaxID=2530451 RepID=A0A4Z0BDY4_9BURK|nr:hypothetical protein [Ramlibacter humi]TFY96683.1 hypothetical protein EZ216_20070 [Ramlibacter humi]